MEFNIFKIEYYWPEDEHEVTLLGKNVEIEEFEKDLVLAKDFAISLIGKEIEEGDYLGRGYRVECLPEYYAQIIWFLMNKKDYTICYADKSIRYRVNYSDTNKIGIKKQKRITQTKEL